MGEVHPRATPHRALWGAARDAVSRAMARLQQWPSSTRPRLKAGDAALAGDGLGQRLLFPDRLVKHPPCTGVLSRWHNRK